MYDKNRRFSLKKLNTRSPIPIFFSWRGMMHVNTRMCYEKCMYNKKKGRKKRQKLVSAFFIT